MATEIVMPRLGWTMEEGSVVEWLKKDGDLVQQGEIIFTVEGDKAVIEIESFESGILRIPPDSPPPGTVIPVGRLLAYLVQPGEAVPFETHARSLIPAPSTTTAHSTPIERPRRSATNGKTSPTISPRARRVAAELGVDWATLKGSGRTGRIVERDVRAAIQLPVEMPDGMRISPLARRMAEELHVDLTTLAASMPGKRIEKADVERAAASAEPPLIAGHISPTTNVGVTIETRLPMSTVRRITASRMSASLRTTAPVTLTTEADATELVKLRKQMKIDGEATARPIPTYTDLLAKLTAEALIEFSALNSRLDGEQIVQSEAVHIGIAVDTDRGLLVPVVHDVHAKSLRQIAKESATLIERARRGSLTADEMSGGTFSISNLGMYEIDAFTPIINLPECAILGVGRIIPKQMVIDEDAESLAIRQMMFLSLTFDHRLVDGGPAARFLQRVKQFIEHPYSWLL